MTRRPSPAHQLFRRATIGSILEALRAGTYPASNATIPSRTTIPRKVAPSAELMPNSSDAISRDVHIAATVPTAIPIIGSIDRVPHQAHCVAQTLYPGLQPAHQRKRIPLIANVIHNDRHIRIRLHSRREHSPEIERLRQHPHYRRRSAVEIDHPPQRPQRKTQSL